MEKKLAIPLRDAFTGLMGDGMGTFSLLGRGDSPFFPLSPAPQQSLIPSPDLFSTSKVRRAKDQIPLTHDRLPSIVNLKSRRSHYEIPFFRQKRDKS